MPAATLLATLVDYAGLFPPAGLSMAEAVATYAAERAGADSWMLGRFVCPTARLEEFAAAAAAHWTAADGPWRASALVTRPEVDVPQLRAFNAAHAGQAMVDVVEAKAMTVEEIDQLAGALGDFEAYVEVPLDPDPAQLLEACARLGLRAKARLGGVVPDAFPRPELVARFLIRCHEAGVAFKATAGLHHAVRGAHPITYDAGAPRVTMHGFLNLLFATQVVAMGGDAADACAALEERDATAFVRETDSIRWRAHAATVAQLVALRQSMTAIGSCSFREPVQELDAMGIA